MMSPCFTWIALVIFFLVPLKNVSALESPLDFTVEDAHEKFQARELHADGLANALEASQMFQKLFEVAKSEGKSDLELGQLLGHSAMALFFYADNTVNNEIKKKEHYRGWEMSIQAAAYLHQPQAPTTPKIPEYKRPLAGIFYWQAAHMGKWALANGVVNSLARWPELKRTIEYIFTLDEKDIESFGANRILGRCHSKLPFPIGDRFKAQQLLEEAFDQTLDSEGGISTHSTNVVYYAEILVSRGKPELAKTILHKLVAKGESEDTLREYNENRIPETKADIAEAKLILSKLP